VNENRDDPAMLPLRDEIALFNRSRAEWIAVGKSGAWVAIKGRRIVSFFRDMAEAYAAGLREFGEGPFLVREIKDRDEAIVMHRFRPSHRN
jgi:hypothetical protein